MSFEDRLTASFRGVEFLLENVDGKGGRRAIPHAYPKKESGWTEDNGAVLTNQKISGRVVGKDYLTQLRNLLTALNTSGPGEMVHPWWGTQTVQVGEVTHRFDNNEDLTAIVEFEVFESGKNLFPSASTDTASKLASAAGAAADSNNSWFSSLWDGSALTGMGDMVDTFLTDLNGFTQGLPSTPSSLQSWSNRLANIKDSIGSLLAYPGKLGLQLTNLLYDVKSTVSDPIRALSVYDLLNSRWAGMRAEQSATGKLSRNVKVSNGFASAVNTVSTTALNDSLNSNVAAFKQLVLNATVIGKASTVAESDFSYAQQAQDIGDVLSEQLNDLAKTAIESGDRTSWRSFRSLRVALVNDINERALQLPSLRVVTTTRPVPVALIAWRELGDAEQRADIISRNKISNPAIIPVGTQIKVIDNG